MCQISLLVPRKIIGLIILIQHLYAYQSIKNSLSLFAFQLFWQLCSMRSSNISYHGRSFIRFINLLLFKICLIYRIRNRRMALIGVHILGEILYVHILNFHESGLIIEIKVIGYFHALLLS